MFLALKKKTKKFSPGGVQQRTAQKRLCTLYNFILSFYYGIYIIEYGEKGVYAFSPFWIYPHEDIKKKLGGKNACLISPMKNNTGHCTLVLCTG